MGSNVTLKDVAAAAKVSPTTASRVLSGVGRNVDPVLARRVWEAQSELGYRVNAAARALRTQSSGAVGLVVPGIANPYFAELVSAFSRALQGRGLRLITIDTQDCLEAEARHLSGLDQALLDAVLVVPVHHRGSRPALARLAEQRPVVQVDRIVTGLSLPRVHLDNGAGMEALVNHLRETGHSRILLVDAQPQSFSSQARMAAFQRLAGPQETVLQLEDFTISSGRRAAASVLAQEPEQRPDAVLCTADVIALGMLSAFQNAGVNVPGDLAMASFDGTSLCEISSPALTSLAPHTHEIAEAALTLLESAAPGREVLIEAKLLVRASTAGVTAAHENPR